MVIDRKKQAMPPNAPAHLPGPLLGQRATRYQNGGPGQVVG